MNLGFTTVHVGGGLLVDCDRLLDQDSASREQFPDLTPQSTSSAMRASSSAGASRRSGRSRGRRASCTTSSRTSGSFRQTGLMVAVPGDLQPLLRRAREGGVQSQQGDDGLRRLDDGAPSVHRRDRPAACRRHQVARLRADAIICSGMSACSRTGCRGADRSRPTTTSSSCARAWVPMASATARDAAAHGDELSRRAGVTSDSLRLRSKPEAFPAPVLHRDRQIPGDVRAGLRTRSSTTGRGRC